MHLSEGPLIDGPIMQERSKFRYSIFSSSKIRTQDARVESVKASSAVQAHLKLKKYDYSLSGKCLLERLARTFSFHKRRKMATWLEDPFRKEQSTQQSIFLTDFIPRSQVRMRFSQLPCYVTAAIMTVTESLNNAVSDFCSSSSTWILLRGPLRVPGPLLGLRDKWRSGVEAGACNDDGVVQLLQLMPVSWVLLWP